MGADGVGEGGECLREVVRAGMEAGQVPEAQPVETPDVAASVVAEHEAGHSALATARSWFYHLFTFSLPLAHFAYAGRNECKAPEDWRTPKPGGVRMGFTICLLFRYELGLTFSLPSGL